MATGVTPRTPRTMWAVGVVMLGWALAFTGALVAVPQALRVVRTGDVQGLSVTTQVAWVVSWSLWLTYSLTVHAWPKVGAESLGLVVEIAMTAVVLRGVLRTGHLGAALRPAVVFAGVGAVACVGARVGGGPEALAGALTVFDGASLAPALWAVWRSASLAGLSGASWALRAAVAGGWIAYGFGFGHPLAAGWAFVMCPVAVVVSIRIARDRRSACVRALRPPAAVVAPTDRGGTMGSHGTCSG